MRDDLGTLDADPQSVAESKQLASNLSADEVKRRAQHNEANRTETFRNHLDRLSLVTLYIVWAVVVLIGLFWAWHMMTPNT